MSFRPRPATGYEPDAIDFLNAISFFVEESATYRSMSIVQTYLAINGLMQSKVSIISYYIRKVSGRSISYSSLRGNSEHGL